MRVFLYEYFVGGGALADEVSEPVCREIFAEAAGMWRAVAQDLTRAGVHVIASRDPRWPHSAEWPGRSTPVHSADEERRVFHQLSAASDWTLVIAPETDGALLRRVRWAVAAGGRLASPDPEFVELAGDKSRSCERLRVAGVPTPLPWPDLRTPSPRNPVAVKRRDGCASQDMRVCRDAAQFDEAKAALPFALRHCEAFVAGIPVGVAALGDGRGWRVLPPWRQLVDAQFKYHGGARDLSPAQERRASDLTEQALAALPATHGYVGVDLVLAESAAADVVLEINPRITSSYIGLSRVCCDNMGSAMLAAAAGEWMSLRFRDPPYSFRVASA